MLGFLGIVAVAVGILISVSLHEAGHMGSAKSFGMKVTRYFVGFGPTLWSKVKGGTEYGVKGIPLGGFVKIVGMTPQDEDADDKKAMWRFPVWKRTIVMAAGSIVHFVLAFLIFWGVAATAAMPNPAINLNDPFIRVVDCIQRDELRRDCTADDPSSAAKAAGLETGDKVLKIGSTSITTYKDMITTIRALPAGEPTQFTVLRKGQELTKSVTPVTVERRPIDDPNGAKKSVSAVGFTNGFDPALSPTVHYNPVDALGVAVTFMGRSFVGVADAIKSFPEKIPGLWTAITGGERDPNSPVSVVGATRIGGELAELGEWPSIFLVIASLNLFVGLFNLLPLLPLDGGHIAIAWFEKARSWVYARLRKPDPGRVDYYKLMPLTYTVILIFGAFTLLTVTADIVNPISILK
jgi:membrane-associated protease RseP (regulator of RpoE activity)